MKHYKIILVVLGALIVASLGVTYGYYTNKTTVQGTSAKSDNTTAEIIKIVYDAGTSKLQAQNLVPGKSVSKTFKVKVTPTSLQKTASYSIKFNISSNSFKVCSNENYSTTNKCTKGAEELVVKLKNSKGEVLAQKNITGTVGFFELAKETHTVTSYTEFTYTIEVSFKELNSDQNHNLGKSLVGTISVTL